jgi:hypothetical protein
MKVVQSNSQKTVGKYKNVGNRGEIKSKRGVNLINAPYRVTSLHNT